MAEQVNNKSLERLKLRQEALLNKIGSLQFRLNSIQRSENVAYDTSNITVKQFKKLQSKQSDIFTKLLTIASQIENISTSQNIKLPAESEIKSVIDSMSSNLKRRQQRSLTQLKVLKNIANSIQTMNISPQIKTLIIDDENQTNDSKSEEKDDKKSPESNKYKSRYYDLELVSESLRNECKRMDSSNNGFISTEQLNIFLEKITLIDVDKSIKNEKHIQLIINELSDNNNINYNQFFDLIMDFNKTDQFENKNQWNLFRHNLIGNGRIDGSIRILYRFDGWPEPLNVLIKDIKTKTKNYILLKEVLKYIQKNEKNVVEYKELRYAANPTFVPGKRGWEPLNSEDIDNEKVPFLLNNDGTLEIDVWLRTKGFIESGKGKPLPEESDEDLVDVD